MGIVSHSVHCEVTPPTFFNGGHDGGKVIIKQDHVSYLFGHLSASNAHGYA